MSKKTFFLISVLFIILAIFGLFYWWNSNAPIDPSTGEKTSFFSFLPFSNNKRDSSNDPNYNQNPNDNNTNATSSDYIPRLRQISNEPTAGYISFERKASSTLDVFAPVTIATTATNTKATSTATTTTDTIIQFMDRSTGHIFETKSTTFTNDKVSNQTYPKMYNAFFGQKGDSFVTQTITDGNNIKSFIGVKAGTSTPTTLASIINIPLTGGIENIATPPKLDKFFFLINTGSGSIGYIKGFNNLNPTQIFSSPLSEWIAAWPKDDTLALTTKASDQAPGILIFVNTKTGAVSNILRGIFGLTTLVSPDATNVLYSEIKQFSSNLYAYNVKSGLKTLLTINTLPEKCVWSKKTTSIIYCAVPDTFPPGDYPDSWYKGLVSFNDQLWKIDLSNGQTTMIMTPEKEGRTSIDMINLSLSEKENFIYFINKKDLTLWSYQLQ